MKSVLMAIFWGLCGFAFEIPPYDQACREDDPAFQKGRVMQVLLDVNQHGQPLFKRPIDCPKEGICGWRLETTLKTGDKVYAGSKAKSYICVMVEPERKILGWIPTKALTKP